MEMDPKQRRMFINVTNSQHFTAAHKMSEAHTVSRRRVSCFRGALNSTSDYSVQVCRSLQQTRWSARSILHGPRGLLVDFID